MDAEVSGGVIDFKFPSRSMTLFVIAPQALE